MKRVPRWLHSAARRTMDRRRATQTVFDFEVDDFVSFNDSARRVHGWVIGVGTDYVVVKAFDGGAERCLSPTELDPL